jgi:hypothetical protein
VIYVETLIHAPMDEIWRATQQPEQHQRWDLRFGHIEYQIVERGLPQRFRYSVSPLPGLSIDGVGTTVADRHRPDGSRISALRFNSEHPLSPIRSGAGYWRYEPMGERTRFLTGYRYRGLRMSIPVMGWATAWSFDRLRLWMETGRSPRRLLAQASAELLARCTALLGAFFLLPWWGITAVATLALLTPPLPGTPAARRCLRRPPDAASNPSPNLMSPLEQR